MKDYRLFKESKNYSNKNLITEICVSMILLNNEFLDSILDRGLKARYSENSQIFLTDLKNLLIAKNRLKLGKIVDNRAIEDDEVSKINGIFDSVEFDIEKDWNLLINARNSARNISDKLLPDQKLDSEMISKIFWIGPNKSPDSSEDIVIELKDGRQFSFYLNKNVTSSKTSSFHSFSEELIGQESDKLFSEEYLPHWNKLCQQWIKTIYENANKTIQSYIEKFIDPKRIDTINYFEYFDIRHSDPKFQHLGEFFKELDKNILKLSDLLNEIWKNKETCFMDPERVKNEWIETKIVILNSKILENLFTKSLKSKYAGDIEKTNDNFKKSSGVVKMKLFKCLVEKLGCLERPLFFVNSSGSQFTMIPARDFFRKFYDDLDIKFDYHVNFVIDKESEEANDFKIKIILENEGKILLTLEVDIKFSGGEMSGKLSAKSKFELASDFNYIISKKYQENIKD